MYEKRSQPVVLKWRDSIRGQKLVFYRLANNLKSKLA